MRHTPIIGAFMALLAATNPGMHARADDAFASMFSFSGFGTLGVVHSSEDRADFTSTIFKPNGAGYSRAWSPSVDSLVALQVLAKPSAKWSAVLQVMSEQNYDGRYTPHVEWANVQYQFTPDFSVRVGRTVLPAFLLSENRKVGYTFPYVRPPLEVYRLLPVTTSDGFDVSYRLYRGEMSHTLQANIGRSEPKLANNPGTAEANHAWGATYTLEQGQLTVRATYKSTDLTIGALNPLFDAFRQFGPQGSALADRYDSDDKLLVSYGIGASYDPGPWFVMSEWHHVDPHSFQGKRIAWYASGGVRLGKLTPFVHYARSRAGNLADPGLSLAGLPPALAGQAAGLNAALNGLLRSRAVQDTVAIGVRWDFMKNVDLKLQFNHTRVGEGSNGVFTNVQPGFQAGPRVNLFSATVDFVF